MKIKAIILFALILFVTAVQAQVVPNEGEAVVNGDVSEWTSDDYAVDLLKAWGKEKLGELYLRYDCADQVMYVYVKMTEGEYVQVQSGDEVYIKVNGSKRVSSDDASFAWVALDDNQAQGWEASFTLTEGAFSFDIHTNVWQDNESQTMGYKDFDVLIECEYDYGDATGTPPAYNVMDQNRIRLGGTVDNETEQQEDGFCAGGDDALDGNDDEDGVTFKENGVELAFNNYIMSFQKGKTMQVSVNVFNQSGKDAVLRAWVDYNGDGDFRDDQEDIINTSFNHGTETVYNTKFIVPNESFVVEDQTVFFRFRLQAVGATVQTNNTTGEASTVLGAENLAAVENTVDSEGRGGYGEVEDYGVQFTGSPIAVVLSQLAADVENDLVHVRWTAESEVDHAGYNVYRSTKHNDGFVKLNEKMILSSLFDHRGSSYVYKDQVAENGEYFYRLEAVNLDGTSKLYGPVTIKVSGLSVTSVEDQLLTESFKLNKNYPNPFNPVTTISFNLPSQENIDLRVYDIQGRLVNTLVSGSLSAGEHRIVWDATSQTGEPVASGVYFYQLTSESFNDTRQMTLIR
ncbi:MAG: T9SS type A sorting domain-containing protein [candidate division KSB1 bacterium]|nr:T9SS type A sorting domain-containing protein [candidate division KSB1 bacterium]